MNTELWKLNLIKKSEVYKPFGFTWGGSRFIQSNLNIKRSESSVTNKARGVHFIKIYRMGHSVHKPSHRITHSILKPLDQYLEVLELGKYNNKYDRGVQ